MIRAYLTALAGSDELPQLLPAPARDDTDLPDREQLEAAKYEELARRGVSLTLEQWKLRTRDLATHICQSFLANTAGWVTVREISDATRFKPEAVKKALKALDTGGLTKFSGNRARAPRAPKSG